MQPAADERLAVSERRAGLTDVVAAAHPVLNVRFQPLELLVEKHVHHARDSIRTVGRRGAAGNDVDLLDEHRRDHVHVHAAGRIGRTEPAPVEQQQRAVATEAAQIEIAGAERRADLTGVEVHAQSRNVLHQVGDVTHGLGLQLLHADRSDRRRRSESGDARSGDGDLGDFLERARALLGVRQCRCPEYAAHDAANPQSG